MKINSIDYRHARPLQNAWQHGTMLVALPSNVEGRNGQFRDGGHCKTSWLDTHKAQASKPPVPVCFQAQGRKDGRAVRGATQQSWRNVTRTVQNSTSEKVSFVEVLPVASERVSCAVKPRCLPRRSIESRHVHYSIRHDGLESSCIMQPTIPLHT